VAPKPIVVEEVVVEPEPVVVAEVENTPPIVVADEPSTSTPIEEPEVDKNVGTADLADPVADAPPAPAGQIKREPPSRRPMVVKSKPSTEKGDGWMTWAFAGIGMIALLLGGALVARRMKGAGEVDFTDESGDDSGGVDTAQAGSDENPFESLSGDDQQMTLSAPGGETATSFGTDSGDTTIGSLTDEEKESESLFGDSEEKNMDEMEMISREQINESLGGMPSAAGGIPEEFQQMMREMNLRVETLEGRIDELVDARDRLERQVAAQTEELRVQRAAIARTQRAVRNLARPEDGEDDQEPTEPALRDPNATS
jgi:hypothetical protein